ncbi:MAG: hypothetical protein FJ295_18385 [Planctomycetes bacterium]|nr:hypothetical protein [Planctomycetota bacterium]
MVEPLRTEWERRLMGALGDVPVPAGLLRRVSDRMGLVDDDARSRDNPPRDVAAFEAAVLDAAALDGRASDPAVAGVPGDVQLPERFKVRMLLASAGLVVAIGLLFVGFAWFTNRVAPHSELRDQAIGWTLTLPEQWLPLEAMELEPPVPAQLRTSPVACQRIATRYDANTMVYLLDPQSRRAVLFAFRQTPRVGLGASVRNLGGIGGWEIAAWEDGNVVYVLSVNAQKGQRLDQHLRYSERVAGNRDRGGGWRLSFQQS